MAIQIQIRHSGIVQRDDGTRGIALDLTTTNDSFPSEEVRYSGVYATTLTAAQIKSAIDAEVTLLWQAKALPSWTV